MNDRALQRAALTISALRTRLDAAEADRRPPIGVLGIGLRLPGGIVDPVGFWSALSSGADLTSDLPAERWGVDDAALADLHDPSGARTGTVRSLRGGWLGPVDGFDAAFWGISPREATGLDPQQRLLLECAWEALEDAAIDPLRLRGRRVGVYVGICGADYGQLAASAGLRGIDAYHASGTQHSVASGRIAYALGLTGPAVSVDTACSSSLVALHLALRALRAGECDLALVGGVNLILGPTNSVGFSRAGMLSPDGRCKAFSAAADGYGRAEGCAVVVLGRLAEASAGQVWAVLHGSALGQDGASGGLTVPNGPAQASVIRAALADAGAEAARVGYVEAHGTGTSLGDPIEAGALSAVFGAGRAAPLLVGSAKANLGHTEGAAGLVGLVKAALVRHHGTVPPHPFAEQPTPHVDWTGSGLALPGAPRPLAADALVGVSSFGFSGTNAHAVLGVAPAALARGAFEHAIPARAVDARNADRQAAAPAERPGVFVLSARSPTSLAGLAAASAERLAELASIAGTNTGRTSTGAALMDGAAPGAAVMGGASIGSPGDWTAACWTAATGRAALPWRRAVVAASAADAAAALRGAPSPAWNVAASGPVSGPVPLVWLFTGQGALRPGAGAGLLDTEPAFAEAWHTACAAFAPYLPAGAPPLHTVLHGADAAHWLQRPSLAQPAHIALAVALAALWRARGITPALVLGHSLGEYAAAYVAGVLDLDGLARLIAGRGRLCETLAPGSMAATTASEAEVTAALAKLPTTLANEAGLAALHGSAGSTVSGSPAALAALCEALATMGHASDRLTGGQAYHSPLTQPAMAPLAALAAEIKHETPRIPLASTLTGELLGQIDWPSHWARHLRQPVRFAEALDTALRAAGDGAGQAGQTEPVALEIGPHPTLASLARRLHPGLLAVSGLLPDVADPLAIHRATATLWMRGVEPAWAKVLPEPHRLTALPNYPWDRTRYWIDRTPDLPTRPPVHPLLGDRQPGPGTTWRFLAQLDPARQPVLAGHCIDRQPVLPAAAMLAMAQAAATLRWPATTVTIEDTAFERPLWLLAPTAVQLVMNTDAKTWEIHATPQAQAEAPDAHWTRHATGRLHPGPLMLPTNENQPPAALVDAAPFHAAVAESGLHLTQPYHGLRRYALGDASITADIEVTEPGLLAPMLRLDAALQAAALLAPHTSLRIPATIGRVALAPLPAAFQVRAQRPTADGDDILADLTLWTTDGEPLGGIEALRLRPPGASDPLADIAWTVTWRELPAPPLPCAVASNQASALAGQLAALQDHAALLGGLERGTATHAARALAALGVPAAAGSRIQAPADLGVVPRHHALFGRLLAMLEADGTISRNDDGAFR
jgi:acyl transferase domain-containing protein